MHFFNIYCNKLKKPSLLMRYKTYSITGSVSILKSDSIQLLINGVLKRIFFCLLLILPKLLDAQSVDSWLTTGDKSKLFQLQPVVNIMNSNPGGYTISIDTAVQYQTMDGFGFALTEGSAEVISALTSARQDSLLRQLFDPVKGIGLSVLRIGIGASDLNAYSYSYDEVPAGSNDTGLTKFSLSGPDSVYLIPILKKILAINPEIKVMGSPWSAPRWMKTKYTWIGDTLNRLYYKAYATYFVKYLDAMKANGINIWAITPQNEPENPKNEPSMIMTANQQIDFINNHLGPAIQKSGHSTKIIAFDHNCDNTAYPIAVCNQSPYVDGAAFHLYAGQISALSQVHTATGKNIYFTEQYTSNSSDFSSELASHMNKVMIGSVNNWAKTAIEWNLASDINFDPHTPGGCTTCMGAITIGNPQSFTKNVSYYIAAHMSQVIKPGAKRIGVLTTNDSLQTTAFKNTDQSIALVVMNNMRRNADITVGVGGKYFSHTIPANTASSFIWGTGQHSSIVLITPNQSISSEILVPLNLPVNVIGGLVSRIEFYSGINLVQTDSIAPYILTWSPEIAEKSIITCKAFDVNGRFVSSLEINLNAYTFKPVPGTIQAEDYDVMAGVGNEACSDIGGGQDVGNINPNDFMEYYVNVKKSGLYKVDFRVAALASRGNNFTLLMNGALKTTISVPVTGGFQIWATVSTTFHLDAGKQLMRVNSSSRTGWNINYMVFSQLDSSITGVGEGNFINSELLAYTYSGNENILNVRADFGIYKKIVLSLSNCLGETLLQSEYANPGKEADLQLNTVGIPSGIYFLKVQSDNVDICRKIIKH